MPSETHDPHTDGPDQRPGQERRAVIVVSDGAGIPKALDRTRARVNRMPGLRAVDVEHDNHLGEGFLRAVDRYRRGEIDTIVVTRLPQWIVVTDSDARP